MSNPGPTDVITRTFSDIIGQFTSTNSPDLPKIKRIIGRIASDVIDATKWQDIGMSQEEVLEAIFKKLQNTKDIDPLEINIRRLIITALKTAGFQPPQTPEPAKPVAPSQAAIGKPAQKLPSIDITKKTDEEFTKKIAAAKNVNELVKVIEDHHYSIVSNNGKELDKAVMIEGIKKLSSNPGGDFKELQRIAATQFYITSNYGLRDKFTNLVKAEAEKGRVAPVAPGYSQAAHANRASQSVTPNPVASVEQKQSGPKLGRKKEE